ncbi:unnamed protein product [Paramecium sonneborni]|uniref:Uncharacterized protein n=1 Tax=Paramecium sonneborni TaxID=65129 RepID=A0A8S1KSI6_9CILI|nr:unnamed protein product [Paramecium sonneborni]
MNLRTKIQTHLNELKLKIKNIDEILTQIKEIEKQIQNQIINFQFHKKAWGMFWNNKSIINIKKHQYLVSIPDLYIPNRSQNCSTAPSPGMKVQIKSAYKKGLQCNFEF